MHLFELEHLSLTTNEDVILNNLSLTIEENDFLTITGASGSGKSTFLKILATLTPFSSGSFFYKGKNINEIDTIGYRREVSYCFQQPTLFGETVMDNLFFPFTIRNLPFDEKKASQALSEVNLAENFLEKKIIDLSGGEKQRVALVRNLLFEPKVLLLDEVTTGLDKENKKVIQTLLQKRP